MDRTHDGRPIKIMTLIDKYTRQDLARFIEPGSPLGNGIIKVLMGS
jgi:hypothetical protein